jgi:c-di-AMP phosphodiesterase-like protein
LKPKKFWSLDLLWVLLAIACVVLAVLLCVADPVYLPAALGLTAFLALLAAFDVKLVRHGLRRLFNAKGTLASAANSGFAALGLPMAAVSSGQIIWYNNAFRHTFGGDEDVPLALIKNVIPGLDLKKCEAPAGYDVDFAGRHYTAWASSMRANPTMSVLVLADVTNLKIQAAEYQASRPAVMYVMIDAYEDIMRQTKEGDRTAVLAEIHAVLEKYVEKNDGFLCHISSSRYVALIEERYVAKMVEDRFSVLDTARKIDSSNQLTTLSIGIGRGGEGFAQGEVMAQQALDMALGRGGDQVAIKSQDSFEFFGGVSRGIEKRSRVKSRIAANSIAGLVEQAGKVLVMGHKNSDMDSVGAAVGMARFVTLCGKPAHVVLNRKETLAASLVDYLCENGETPFMTPQEAAKMAGEDALVIVVDTHMPYLLESEDVF